MSVKLGRRPDSDAKRDAVHVAIIPATAGHDMNPGEEVGFMDGNRVSSSSRYEMVGIVDPFLKGWINEGDRIWVIMKPDLVSEVRHDWRHDGVPAEDTGHGYNDGCSPGCG